MKPRLKFCCALFVACLFTAQAQPLRLVTHHLPPYQIVDGDALSGRTVSIMQCAMTEVGVHYEVDVRPIGRAEKELKEGKFDGLFILNQTAERDAFAKASDPLVVTYRSLFSLQEVEFETNSAEMKAMNIGVLHGSAMHKWMAKHQYTNVQSRYDYHILFELLQLGRLDAVMAPFDTYYVELEHGHITQEIAVKHLREANLSAYFNFNWLEKYPQFLPQFNTALAACR
ncbi:MULTISPECIES: substrate-binding periplasmic protein [unclassified Agarivorans]|uniref:substrate-binding periplasmic protein n=1 Tax=unclassified Agarivorans TaxID=2636026 RepID=UPI0026E48FB4|nr:MULTISPECIES: transporter substrate-binding domain-containing protein [unclassified Agarivorans]MDO6686567.1 transporter substrate-binding domain-containing protein [Agarivorans sp. 3_MG-2023]MDO6715385.1 transporter substrate-binding domain-containing protein [Agarivorans sp. 2_MG-2023]MDO6763298.1 transporter substrate-binding domain-containing protein [Agarivorans sp. 1_MG-2023]